MTAERRGRGNRLLDRVYRRRVGDDERDVDPDEHHQHELTEAPQRVPRISAHAVRGGYCRGLSFTIMYRVLPQFGTGSV